jgi:voltage-gated potassium channel
MFFLSLAFLVAFAGAIHRLPRLRPGDIEEEWIRGGLAGLWLIFIGEAGLRFQRHRRDQPAWRAFLNALICAVVPPLRMACRGHERPDHIWLPWLGWSKIDAPLRHTLERFFSIPMVVLAAMVLPLFFLEYQWADQVRAHFGLALALDIGTSFIWLAFTVELIVMCAVAERPLRYCGQHWIDVAVVLLPLIEGLPVLRLLRVGRTLRLEPLLRWGRLQRLHALALRGWRALLLLQIAQRLTGRSLESRLRQLQDLLRAKEDDLEELRREIREVEERIAEKARGRAKALPQVVRADNAGR